MADIVPRKSGAYKNQGLGYRVNRENRSISMFLGIEPILKLFLVVLYVLFNGNNSQKFTQKSLTRLKS